MKKKGLKLLAVVLSVLIAIQVIPMTAFGIESTSSVTQAEIKDSNSVYMDEDISKRSEYEKHFKTSDGISMAVYYPQQVNYLTPDGYQEIDNTLVNTLVDGKSYLENKNNSFKVKLPEKLTGKSVDITYGEYSLSWEMDNTSLFSSNVQVENGAQVVRDNLNLQKSLTQKEEQIAQLETKAIIDNGCNTSKALYKSIQSNVDIQYNIEGQKLKESIILNKKSSNNVYSFTVTANGLTAVKQQDGSVVFYNSDNKEIFKIDSPYMFDAAGAESTDITVELSGQNGVYKYKIIPSAAWLTDSSRVYPITIDPSAGIGDYNISETRDKAVSFKTKAESQSSVLENEFVNNKLLPVGLINGEDFGSIVYAPMPYNIPKSARIVSAQLLVQAKESEDYTYNAYERMTILASQVTEDWITGFANNNTPLYKYASGQAPTGDNGNNSVNPPTPAYNQYADDYYSIQDGFSGTYYGNNIISFNITKSATNWMNGEQNYGIMLTIAPEEIELLDSSDNLVCFNDNSSNNDQDVIGPKFIYYYLDTTGYEDYWSYHTQSSKYAGTGYINDFNGSLTFIHDDFSTVGELPTVTVSHVYNSNNKDVVSHYGNGWKLNVVQTLLPTGNENYPYRYMDGDGTYHYFYDDNGTYKDEDGLGLIMSSCTEYGCIRKITDKGNNSLYFNANGNMLKAVDSYGNVITYAYSPSNLIESVTDANGNRIKMNYVGGNGLLESIVDESTGRRIEYDYTEITSDKLISIVHVGISNTEIEYENNKIINVYDGVTKYNIHYGYNNTLGFSRVNFVQEGVKYTDSNNVEQIETGRSMKISYDNYSSTSFRDCGLNGVIEEDGQTSDDNILTYQFDNLGQVVSVYDAEGESAIYGYNYSNAASKENKHQLASVADTQKTVINYVRDPNIDQDGWEMYTNVSIDTNVGYHSKRSLKITSNNQNSDYYTTTELNESMLSSGTYTLSCYVKTQDVVGLNDNCGVYMALIGNGKWQKQEFLVGTTDVNENDGWVRLEHTFTDVVFNGSGMVMLGIVGASGTVWFDCVMLEEGETASNYNYVSNGDFSYGPNNWFINAYNPTSTFGPVGNFAMGFKYDTAYANPAYQWPEGGRPAITNTCTQIIDVCGDEEDVFYISGWAKALNAMKTLGSVYVPYFRIKVAVNYDGAFDGVRLFKELEFNPHVRDWQYGAMVFSTEYPDIDADLTYDCISITIEYSGQINPAYFTGIQLIRDSSSTSYTYDDKGNMTSSASKQTESQFNYDGSDNLISSIGATGTGYKYNYDSKKGMTSAYNTDGAGYSFEYNSKGQAVNSYAYGGINQNPINAESDSPENNAIYRLKVKSTGKYVTMDGSDITYDDLNSGNNQYFKLEKYSGDCYYIHSLTDNSKVIYTSYNVAYLGTKADHMDYRFVINQDTTGTYRIRPSGYQGYPLKANNNQLQMVAEGDSDDQRFILEKISSPANTVAVQTQSDTLKDDGIYRIRVLGNNKYLTVAGDRVVAASINHTDSQIFRLRKHETVENYYYLHLVTDQQKVLCTTYNKVVPDYPSANVDNTMYIVPFGDGYYKMCQANYQNSPIGVDNDDGLVWMLDWDQSDNVKLIFEELESSVSSAVYNESNTKLLSTTDGRGLTTAYTYDSNNRLTSSVTVGSGDEAQTTEYEYNSRDDIESVTSAGRTVGYLYDSQSRLSSISHNGFYYNFGYDLFGNTTSVSVGSNNATSSNVTLVTNTYKDNNGMLETSIYGNGFGYEYEYDKKYNVKSIKQISPDGNKSTAVEYVYDTNGNLKRKKDLLSNVEYTYNYDFINRPESVKGSDGSKYKLTYDKKNRVVGVDSKTELGTVTTEYVYGDTSLKQFNDVVYKVKHNGNENVSYTYDELGRRKTTTLISGNTTEYTYENGVAGLVSSVTNSYGTDSEDVYDYTYDQFGNIKKITKNGTVIGDYTYDKLGQLTSEYTYIHGLTHQYIYDNGGNITAVKENTYNYKTFEYNDPVWKDRLTKFCGMQITYDEIGNIVNSYNGTYTWEGRKLVGVNNYGDITNYEYDSDGNRIRKTVGGVTTDYYWQNGVLQGQKTGSEYMIFLYDENGSPYAMILRNGTTETTYYYQKNLQGDIVSIYDSNGNRLANYHYDSWGNLAGIETENQTNYAIADKNPLRYRGYYYDNETGFYYLSSRYYSPVLYRFISADGVSLFEYKLKNLTQYNMYSYCFCNPINYYDPTGSFPWLIVGLIVLGGVVTSEITKEVNYASNKTAQAQLPSGYIQRQSEIDYMKMGFYDATWNGCGWIAAYNAMIMLGNPQNAADVIRYFDGAGKTFLFGTFGVVPSAISGYLSKQGCTGVMNMIPGYMPSDIENVARKASACILLYAHSSGAHYVALRWDGEKYCVYNDRSGFSSIKDYMSAVNGTFIKIWCID